MKLETKTPVATEEQPCAPDKNDVDPKTREFYQKAMGTAIESGTRFLVGGSGKGINDIDDEWFTFAREREILNMTVKLCPPEEIIWSKSFIMERERYDGADIAHLFRACAEHLDWERLLHRFGPHWELLFSNIILFGFIYPSERARIPEWVMRTMLDRLDGECVFL